MNAGEKLRDGQIFRLYRNAQIVNDQKAVDAHLRRLSYCKQRNVMQLERVDHHRVIDALDRMLAFEGLWDDFYLGALNHILPMHTWQELINYFRRMHDMWQHALDGIPGKSLTPRTVSALELQMPTGSKADERCLVEIFARKSMDRGGTAIFEVFPDIIDDFTRTRLLQRFCETPRVLSFHSFFQDVIYLDICHNSMRYLLPSRKSYKRSFEAAFEAIFEGDPTAFRKSYLELWLFTMRHCFEMSDLDACRPRREKGRPRPLKKQVDPSRLRAFLIYARGRGFSIEGLPISPECVAVEDCQPVAQPPPSSTNVADVSFKARCNRPLDRSAHIERDHLFLHHVYGAGGEREEYVTAFGILRDIFHCFWGERLAEIPSTAHGAAEIPVHNVEHRSPDDHPLANSSNCSAASPIEAGSIDHNVSIPLTPDRDSTLQRSSHPGILPFSLVNVPAALRSTAEISDEQNRYSGLDPDDSSDRGHNFRISQEMDDAHLEEDAVQRQRQQSALFDTNDNSEASIRRESGEVDSLAVLGEVGASRVGGTHRKRKLRDADVIATAMLIVQRQRASWVIIDEDTENYECGQDNFGIQNSFAKLNLDGRALYVFRNHTGTRALVSEEDALRALQNERPYRIMIITDKSMVPWAQSKKAKTPSTSHSL